MVNENEFTVLILVDYERYVYCFANDCVRRTVLNKSKMAERNNGTLQKSLSVFLAVRL